MEENPVEEDTNEINTTLLELQGAFAEALRNAGVLGKLRAQLRAAAISVIRGDPHLRTAAVGKTILPGDLLPEGRVALLLIQDFARMHGLQQTLGVFEEESNLSLVGESEMNTARRLQCSQKSSALEQLIAAAMAHASPRMEEQQMTMTPESMLRAPTRVAATSGGEEEKGHLEAKQEHEEERGPWALPHHPEIAAGLKEYEDSVDYSVVDTTDLSCADESMYDSIDKF
ncbi:hypothetical protein TraAM80_01511 [Trypanosoma rangeli]|uniref:LisH domain-containing protein n=1 Tax=Trypanosoma rangeli TaxID=5698 RepID=A0A3R7NRD8_TRYRA|nr:uncharacterized protein TraAM80_01511 [Trypanosoma rangeli]RNF10465.1 hypothetical protein TraAM80_01511 [Trypanosoma rangeli]|eukprot:RNF10465.1 hypothetical protein TraAM80_01511 [Trypanosoma rangeli]